MMSSATTVKKIRDAMCLDRKEFAQLLGVTMQSVLNYEHGYRTPKRPTIRKLKELARENNIDFSLEDFLGE